MKRKIAIAAGILVTAVSTISGSYAYYQDSVTVTNHIGTGDVNIGIQEYEKMVIRKSLRRTCRWNCASIPEHFKDSSYHELCGNLLHPGENHLFRRGIGFRVKR